ncbi:MAG: glycine cleavage system protein H [Chloroflexi bacterium]|nr:glycine cleavage system protein H [Chloroflexota bacterium]MBI3732615.1 glycine cleavage system protein H [Chloroflexota bacterium]
MRVYRGCMFPEGLLYDVEQDVWVARAADGIATLGMTDPAQTRCGKFVSIRFKGVGRTVPKGKAYATIESAKWVGPFPAVISGEIVETNETTFRRDILIANREPYDTGWMVKVRPVQWEAESGHLLDAERAFAAYQQKIEEWKINCMRCAD